jgi:hypothetical protein
LISGRFPQDLNQKPENNQANQNQKKCEHPVIDRLSIFSLAKKIKMNGHCSSQEKIGASFGADLDLVCGRIAVPEDRPSLL